MKKISNLETKTAIQTTKQTHPTLHQPQTNLKLYKQKKSLNKSLIFILSFLTIGSFWLGKNYGASQNSVHSLSSKYSSKTNSIIEHYSKLNQNVSDSIAYKEIKFDDYLSKLNDKNFNSFSDYLAENSHVYNLFKEDQNYNRQVFIAKHDFTGKDKKLYLDFIYQQNKTSSEFKNLLYKHTDNYKKYINTVRKMDRIVEN